MNYKINEIFYSIQGEGGFCGSPAVFVRFSGCNLKCAFCDTDHLQGSIYSKKQLEDEIEKLTHGDTHIIIVLTGGEPCLQLDDYEPLFEKYETHLETNGTQKIPTWVKYIVCSPKLDLKITDFNRAPDEIKVVFEPGREKYLKYLADYKLKKTQLFIQPLERNGEMNIAEAIEFIKQNPQFKLSVQTHKFLKVK